MVIDHEESNQSRVNDCRDLNKGGVITPAAFGATTNGRHELLSNEPILFKASMFVSL